MKAIRSNVFETNSSSVHSLSIVDSAYGINLPRYLKLDHEEYEWGYSKLRTPEEKFNYLIALVASNYGFTGYYDDDNISSEEFFNLEDVKRIIESVESKGVPILYAENYTEFGHVDHQSVVPLDDFLCGIEIEEFIFNTKYEVIIDNDNH